MSNSVLIPTFRWAQDKENVYVTVDLTGDVKAKVDITDTTVTFSGTANKKEYAFNATLFAAIDPKASSYAVKGREVEILLKKIKSTDKKKKKNSGHIY